MSIWLLTSEYDDYGQHGEYFVEAFKQVPTPDQLIKAGVHEGDVDRVLAGGGRLNNEYMWHNLAEIDPK